MLLKIWQHFLFKAVLLLVIGVLFALVTMPILLSLIEWSYGLSGRNFGRLDTGTLPYIYTAVFGVVVTLLTVAVTVSATRDENRKRSTQQILLDSRLSEYFQERLDLAEKHFPKGKKASLSLFNAFQKSSIAEEKEAAEALRRVLNYYEFIAAGVEHGNLDKDMLKETVRAMLCGLVYDTRDIIRDFRVTKREELNYQNLVAVYWKWVKEENSDEFGSDLRNDRGYLGPH